MKNYYFGLFAEHIVAILYIIKFYTILERRYRNYAGEIDIICSRGRTLVFIEVKARSSNIDDILCKTSQQERITRAATLFLQKNPLYSDWDIRFDLAVVRPYRFPIIIRNAW